MKNIAVGEVFKLKDQVEVVKDSISNVDIVKNDTMSLFLMAFDKGQSLPTHAAPGDILVMALEGEAEITIDGKVSVLKEGEQLSFESGSPHSVKAITEYKMCLLIIK